MVRSNKMLGFDQRYQKAMGVKNAQRQRKARETKEHLEELAEDLEFDRIHKVAERRQKASDPLARLNRIAAQLERDPEMQDELAALDAQQARQQAFLDAQQIVASAQAKHQAAVREAKDALAQQYQSNRW